MMGSVDADVRTEVDDGGPIDTDEAPEDEGGGGGGGLSWSRVAVLAVAVAFLGFAIGRFVTQDRPPGADSVDVGFLQDMLTHHDQALGIATLELGNGSDPVVRSFASEVLQEQSYETGVMTQKLAHWGYSRDDRSDEAMAWMGMPVPVAQMPGLLTAAEMDQIKAARGTDLDKLFLQKMAEHHRGGLHMAQYAAAKAGDPQLRALAARMVRNQSGEINEYRLAAQEKGWDLNIAPASVPPALPSS
jgi:uncharacterized protein (DUF305 family)